MTRMYWKGTKPNGCDICKLPFTDGIFLDAATRQGPWGMLCVSCHDQYGIGMGEGKAQKYVLNQVDQKWYKEEPRPPVKLSGMDGNAFSVLARCREASRKARWSSERYREFRLEACEGNYDHLLQTAMKYFEVA